MNFDGRGNCACSGHCRFCVGLENFFKNPITFNLFINYLLGEAERDDEEEELREEDDLDDADGDRRLGAETIASDEVSCPAICINFA